MTSTWWRATLATLGVGLAFGSGCGKSSSDELPVGGKAGAGAAGIPGSSGAAGGHSGTGGVAGANAGGAPSSGGAAGGPSTGGAQQGGAAGAGASTGGSPSGGEAGGDDPAGGAPSGGSAGAGGAQSAGAAGGGGSAGGASAGSSAAGSGGQTPDEGFPCANAGRCSAGQACVLCAMDEPSASVHRCVPHPVMDPSGYAQATADCVTEPTSYDECDGPEECREEQHCVAMAEEDGILRCRSMPASGSESCCFACGALVNCTLCRSSADCPNPEHECRPVQSGPPGVLGCQRPLPN